MSLNFKVELKKVKWSSSLSRETNAFTADLFINGKHVGYCRNDGNGGNTDISHENLFGKILINEADNFFKLQKVKGYDLNNCLEFMVDELLEDYIQNKDFERHQKKGICFGVSKQIYKQISWKNETIESMKLTEPKRIALRKAIDGLKSKGEIILNTNLQEFK